MTPSEAGRELARAAALVRSTGRRTAFWRGAAFIGPLLVILLSTMWLPDGWLGRPGSLLPMLLGLGALGTLGVAGLVVGGSMRGCRLRSRVVEIERARGLARGDLLGAIELGEDVEAGGLADLHRMRVATGLQGVSARELLPKSLNRARTARRFALPVLGVVLALLAAGLFENPVSARSAAGALARPWTVTFPPPPPPLQLGPPGGQVLRGSAFDVTISASGRSSVLLVQARSGTPPRRDRVAVVDGIAAARIEAVDEVIRFWAEDGLGGVTDTFSVVPLDALTVTDLRVALDYPPYLGRTRDVLSGHITRLDAPAGTQLTLNVRTNHPIDRMGLARTRAAGIDTVVLAVASNAVTAAATVVVTDSVLLSWWIVPQDSVPGMHIPSPIMVHVRPDERPTVSLVYPGEDLVLGLDQTLALVIDARDDHGLAEVGLSWWRESAGGRSDRPAYEALSGAHGARRMVLRPTLDLEAGEFVPGDEIVYYATARDANPVTPPAVSDTFRARLASLDELRSRVALRTEDLLQDTRSLEERAGDLSDGAQDARRRSPGRSQEPGQSGAVERADFGATQEARNLLAEAREIEADLERMREDLREAGSDLADSPLVDSDLQQRLAELEQLFEEILESGLRERIEALEQSLRGLDREGLSEALGEFARQSANLEERLEQALGLMERVALEQSLEGARQTAENLARRQERISDSVGAADRAVDQDQVATESEALAERVDELAARLDEQQAGESADRANEGANDARQAASHGRSAAQEARKDRGSDRPGLSEEAGRAATALARAERSLSAAGQALSTDWRAEALEAVNRATTESLELAREQKRLVERLRSGDRPEDLAGQQSAVREGLDNLSQSLAEAGRKTALMDRRTGPAAAQAGREMDALARSLSSGSAQRSEAMQQGEAAMEALSDLAGSLLAGRRQMEAASSATGMEEALDRLAGMGRQQAGINSESGELFGLMPGGQALRDRLASLAARQEAVSEDLRDLAGDPAARVLGSRPAGLAAEADEVARRLSAGALDRETLERQEQLFRRLLDAGRSLEKDERDANRREATSARPRVAFLPEGGAVEELGPRYPYPDGAVLEALTAAQRRLVYEYFDRLNGEVSGDGP
ncbi:MAG: hypothetical protein KJO06_08465 [Gemmatimonadetes bacterium]|nr:hypothetical protein [Gemmatimonadota bacterium]